MTTNSKKIIKNFLIILVILIISFLIDIFGFNYKQFFLKSSEKGINKIDNYTITETEDKTSVDIVLDKKYINKLRIKYSALDDVPITIKYIEKDYYNGTKETTIEDKFDNEVNELITNMGNDVKKINIIYDKDYDIKITNISIDNSFSLNIFRILFTFTCLFICYLLYVFYKKGFKTENIHKYFIAIAMIIGSLFIILQPSATYYSWDDQIHFTNAYELFGGTRNWSVAEFSMIASTPLGRNSIDTIEEQIQQINYFDKNVDSKYKTIGGRFITYNKVGYIPSSIGYHICDKLGLPFIICFKVGKFMNLLAYVLIFAYAIKISRVGKRLLCVIGLLPSILFLACQYSYDPAVISGLTLALVILINWFVDKDYKVNFKSMLIFLLAILYSSFIKAVYIPFILLFLFVPKNRFENKKESIYLKLGIIVIFLFILYTFVSPATLSQTTGDLRGGNTSVSGQLSLIASYPIGYIKVLKDTFVNEFFYKLFSQSALINYSYLEKASGALNYNYYYLVLLTLIFVGITDVDKTLKRHQRILTMLVCVGVMLLIWTALYLSFTPVGLNTINGVQARYFLPFIFPMFICLQTSKIKNKIDIQKYNGVVIAIMCLVLLISIYELVLKVFCF